MKIVIFGSYNGTSLGDTAILVGLIKSLERVLPNDRLEIRVVLAKDFDLISLAEKFHIKAKVKTYTWNAFSLPIFSQFEKAKFRLSGEKISGVSLKKALSDADMLLIGGGNLIMDLYSAWPPVLQKVCRLSKKMSIPYYFIGVGAGPISRLNSERLLADALSGAETVVFRDVGSKNYVKDRIDLPDSSVMPDLVFGIEVQNFEPPSSYPDDILLLNLAGIYSANWPEKNAVYYRAYIEKMQVLIDYCSTGKEISGLRFFRSNSSDWVAEEDFLENNGGLRAFTNIDSSYSGVSLHELFEYAKSARYAVTTRLHAGLIAALCGCAVLPIAYQPKVRDVFEDLGICNSIDIDKFLSNGFDIDDASVQFRALERKTVFDKRDKIDRELLGIVSRHI